MLFWNAVRQENITKLIVEMIKAINEKPVDMQSMEYLIWCWFSQFLFCFDGFVVEWVLESLLKKYFEKYSMICVNENVTMKWSVIIIVGNLRYIENGTLCNNFLS